MHGSMVYATLLVTCRIVGVVINYLPTRGMRSTTENLPLSKHIISHNFRIALKATIAGNHCACSVLLPQSTVLPKSTLTPPPPHMPKELSCTDHYYKSSTLCKSNTLRSLSSAPRSCLYFVHWIRRVDLQNLSTYITGLLGCKVASQNARCRT